MVPTSDTSMSTPARRLSTLTPLASTGSVMSETDDRNSVDDNANIGKIDNSDQHSITWESTIPDWPGNREPTEKDCLRSLLPDSNNGTVKIPRIQIVPGTCEWLLKDEAFKNWTSEQPSSRLLWLSGFPGTGKTALMAFLLDWLRDRSPVVYFFCNDRDEEQRTVTAILKSLVRQLLQQNPSFSKFVMPEVELSRFGERKGWSAETLWEIFCKIAHDSEVDPIYCLVDALDECEETDGEEISRNELFNLLAEMYSSDSACKLRIIFSSRPYARLQSFLTTVPAIQLRPETTKQDLSQFIVSQLQKAFKNRFPEETKKRVEKYLLDKANGIFLPTSLIIKDLSNCFSEAEIDTLLATIPPSLFRYYDKMLGKIPSADRDRAKQMLMWIVYSPRPLTLEELNMALAVSTDSGARTSLDSIKKLLSNDLKRELETRCGLFIQFREHGNEEYTVHLTHESVSYFFAGGRSMQLPSNFYKEFHVSESDAHELMGTTCITFLQFDDFSSNTVPTERSEAKEYMKRYPFLEYSAFNWPYHIRHGKCPSPMAQEFGKFGNTHSKHFTHWAHLYNAVESPSHFHPTSFLPIHAASLLGLTSLATAIINGGSGGPDSVDTNGRSPLMWAAKNGHKELVAYLLGRSVQVNLMDKAGETALHAAIENRHQVLVELLLERGATLMITTNNPVHNRYGDIIRYDTTNTEYSVPPLNLAIRVGDVGIAKFLVEKGANVTAKDKNGVAPLHAAVENEHEEMIQFLLGRPGVNVSVVDGKKETPLHYAVQKGNEEIVKLLLANNAGVDEKNANGETPFHHAVKKGKEEIVRLLLNKNANVNLIIGNSTTGETALHWAVDGGNKVVVGWLLEKGAEVNGKCQNEGTLLHKAVEKRNVEIVKLLLDKDAGVNEKDGKGETPLHNAVKTGNEEIVRLLLDKGADVNVVSGSGGTGGTALHCAACQGNKVIVMWLLEKGSGVNGKDAKGETSLYNAVKNGNDDIVKLLLAREADVNVVNGSGATAETALHRAIEMEKKEVVVWLLEKGAWVNGKNGKGETPLHNAVKKGNEELVRLLLDNGADVNVVDGNDGMGETALHCAVDHGNKVIVVWLLEKGSGVNGKDRKGETSLHNAVKKGNDDIVKLLLARGADVNVVNGNGAAAETALHRAVDMEKKDVVVWLLEKGAGVNGKDGKGETPLHNAVKKGNEVIVRLLLGKGADVNVVDGNGGTGETALHWAVTRGHKEILKLLAEKGAAVNQNGAKTLISAILQEEKEMVKILLEKGAKVNEKHSDGETALNKAVEKKAKDIVELLLQNGAEVNATNSAGQTAFHNAVKMGYNEIVELLLDYGADVKMVSEGETALHWAVSHGNEELVEWLLQKGADVTATTTNGETPLGLAGKKGYKKIAKLLVDYM